ncbi:hypothetical protein SAMN05444004_12020 [Jannaschia faecimaris]|uniref:Uncharacterized protein n=1 Tax=Jannaschia faecimaris TaxID=1244108 RepID=A0A1H3TX75_9RHOB|nr:hypothetical protein SAMN05444004_12020 [Jannaschia faecimaris]
MADLTESSLAELVSENLLEGCQASSSQSQFSTKSVKSSGPKLMPLG